MILSIWTSVKVLELSWMVKLTAYDFLPSGKLLPSYTSKRLTSFNKVFSVCLAIAKIWSKATVLSINKAKSLRTSGYFGISTNLIFVESNFKIALQLKSANKTSCLMSKCFKIDFLTVPNSTTISFPTDKAVPSANTSLSNGCVTVLSMPKRDNIAVT